MVFDLLVIASYFEFIFESFIGVGKVKVTVLLE